jgi:hypothetical protein
MYIRVYSIESLGEKNVTSGGVSCRKWTPIYIKKTNRFSINKEDQWKKKRSWHWTNKWHWVPVGPDARSERAGCLPAVRLCFCSEFTWTLTKLCTGLEQENRGIAVVNIRHQSTASEDCNRLGRHNVSNSQSQSYVMTDGQSASLSWNKSPIWDVRPDLFYCQTMPGLLMWGALSDERNGLSFARVTVSSNKSVVSMNNLYFACY